VCMHSRGGEHISERRVENTYTRASVYVFACVCVCLCVFVCVEIYIYICVYIYIFIRTYHSNSVFEEFI